jgi:hypothetical protein
VLQNVSLRDRPGFYIVHRLLYDFTFFVVIVIVLKKVLFGIILDTFRELRKKQFQTDSDIANICFICEIEKDECEKNNKSFKEHCENEHNIWEYANYMITLRLKDSQDLNAVNSYAKEQNFFKIRAKAKFLKFKNFDLNYFFIKYLLVKIHKIFIY